MKKKNGLMIILIIVLLCLCLAIAGAILLFLNSGKQVLTQAATNTSLPQSDDPTLPPPTLAPPVQESTEAPRTTGASPVIYLAGRSDISIPPLDGASDVPLFACRAGGFIQETYPTGYRIKPGAEFTFKVHGMVNFYGSAPEEGYPPDGEQYGTMSNLGSFGGISGYNGPAGSLVGVFLDDNIPSETAPEPILFSGGDSAIGVNFPRLEPATGQVFFIGDGVNNVSQQQVFVAPANATRLFIGLADGASFDGGPGCYADNSGSFEYDIHSNQAFEQVK